MEGLELLPGFFVGSPDVETVVPAGQKLLLDSGKKQDLAVDAATSPSLLPGPSHCGCPELPQGCPVAPPHHHRHQHGLGAALGPHAWQGGAAG